MHEASIALSILEIVLKQCRQEGYSSVESVRLEIGTAAGIMPESLRFAFDIAKKGTPADEAELVLNINPVGGICQDCGKNFASEERFVFACPACGSSSLLVNKGREMRIIDMEVN